MNDEPQHRVLYTVTRVASGQWAVLQTGFREPLACFSDQEDAVEYARRLAAANGAAAVDLASER